MTTKEEVNKADEARQVFEDEERWFPYTAHYVLVARSYLYERGWAYVERWPWTWVRGAQTGDLAEALRITMEEEEE